MSESQFRLALNADVCATTKMAEGINAAKKPEEELIVMQQQQRKSMAQARALAMVKGRARSPGGKVDVKAEIVVAVNPPSRRMAPAVR